MKQLKSAVLGVPRIGEKRELKFALVSIWKGKITIEELNQVAASIRAKNWQRMASLGVTYIPSNDFSYYDQVLDMTCALGNIPDRFNFSGETVDLITYFNIARGNTEDPDNNQFASEMTKWFDTNYHYIVPEFNQKTTFKLSTSKMFDEFIEAKKMGIQTRPVLIGPVTYLKIGKVQGENINKYDLLDSLLVVYKEMLTKFEQLGVADIQMDEPIAALDLTDIEKGVLKKAYQELSQVSSIRIHFTTYFGDLRDNRSVVYELPVDVIHVDVTRHDALAEINEFPANKTISLGCVNGRNIWISDYENVVRGLDAAVTRLGEANVIVASSCSLLHAPVTTAPENKLDEQLKQWLSFTDEKLQEIIDLALFRTDEFNKAFEANQAAISNRKTSSLIHDEQVKARVASIDSGDYKRLSSFSKRQKIQHQILNYSLFPTTTIGSFPQTAAVRKARSENKQGLLSDGDYREFLKSQIQDCVAFQEEIGLDVLVHGEFERNDMVEYFGEKLNGFAFTQFGWVQSYGSRCVKPPIIFGDVSRPKPMTVDWSVYAQSLTKQHMKGMLTGPVTILQWSFVRDDQPRKNTAMQIALAIRDEVQDLEKAGIKIVQIDEAALREGLPIRKADWSDYLTWSVDSFRLATAGVSDETQIHTHMCYSEFNDIIEAIARMDADVISIETSRSNMELLDAFVAFNYPNEIGPGVYDIHSPRVPNQKDMTALIKKAADLLPIKNIWVNPDCGLKTRGWPEVRQALTHMVSSAKELREIFSATSV